MTSLQLSLAIAAGILLQITIYLGIGFIRHWQAFRAMRQAPLALDSVNSYPTQQAPGAAAWAGTRAFRVDRTAPEDANGQVRSFYLVPEDGQPLPPYLPGQFLTFRMDVPTHLGATPGETDTVIRCYSLSDAPRPDYYRVTIKRALAPPGSLLAPGVASNYFHDQVAPGQVLQVRAPSGHFHIDRSASPVVLVAGGVGITPLLSMLNWCLLNQPEREVWLFYGVRDGAELVQRAHLEHLAAAHPQFHLNLCVSQPQTGEVAGSVHQHLGRVDVALLRRRLPLKPFHFYICGPTAMLQSLVPALESWGVPDAHIHFEAFGPASVRRKPAATGAAGTGPMVRFAKQDRQFAWQPGMGSLLDLAEANGIVVASGCRVGACGSCQTTVRSGEVSYRAVPDFDPAPGTCLLCVCTPTTAVVLDA